MAEKEHYLHCAWRHIKERCYRPSTKQYEDYGGRGIGMHGPWREDYQAFSEYVLGQLGERPAGMQLDRIDNEKGYVPGNLRWATKKQQMQNRRVTVWVDVDGERLCLRDACAVLGVNYSTATTRIMRGKTPEEAVLPPKFKRRPRQRQPGAQGNS